MASAFTAHKSGIAMPEMELASTVKVNSESAKVWMRVKKVSCGMKRVIALGSGIRVAM